MLLLFPSPRHRAPTRRDFDPDLHARVDQFGNHGGVGRARAAKVLTEHWRDARKVVAAGKEGAHPHRVVQAATGLLQGCPDVAEALLRLRDHVIVDGHGLVVEAGGTGDEDPIAVDHGAAVTGHRLEAGA